MNKNKEKESFSWDKDNSKELSWDNYNAFSKRPMNQDKDNWKGWKKELKK